MDQSKNAWAARFEPLLHRDTVKARAIVRLPPLLNLQDLPTETACRQVEGALKTVFYPTAQCLDVLQRLVGVAHAHCLAVYPDDRTFLEGVYAKRAPLPEFSAPICLTGLAGTGKTELLKAFSRIQAPDEDVSVDSLHAPFPLRQAWSVTVHARASPKDLLRTLAQSDGTPADLVDLCRKMAFRDGVPSLMVDEFQFATGSESANARVTQMLLSLGYIGLPFLFAANFSLLYRLQRRPGEEQQRLLSDPLVLVPDAWSSHDWQETLDVQRSIAPDLFVFDPRKDAQVLHAFSAGRKRAIAKLLVVALRAEHPRRAKVDMDAIRRAYHSTTYARYRDEAEILASQAIQKRADVRRKDLWCPLPLPDDASVAFLKASTSARGDQVATAALESALTGEERQAVADLKSELKRKKHAPAQVVPLPKKTPPSSDELKRNADRYRGRL